MFAIINFSHDKNFKDSKASQGDWLLNNRLPSKQASKQASKHKQGQAKVNEIVSCRPQAIKNLAHESVTLHQVHKRS